MSSCAMSTLIRGPGVRGFASPAASGLGFDGYRQAVDTPHPGPSPGYVFSGVVDVPARVVQEGGMSDSPPETPDDLRREDVAPRQRARASVGARRQLRERLEEPERAGKRPAAPSRGREARNVAVADEERPGREPGHEGHRRAIPAVVDEPAEAPPAGGPGRAGVVAEVRRAGPLIEHIPPTRPRATRVVTQGGHRPGRGEVRSRHPSRVSHASRAARAHLGARAPAPAPAATLDKGHGVTIRATRRIPADLAGPGPTPGGPARASRRVAATLEPAYDLLLAEVGSARAALADETSW